MSTSFIINPLFRVPKYSRTYLTAPTLNNCNPSKINMATPTGDSKFTEHVVTKGEQEGASALTTLTDVHLLPSPPNTNSPSPSPCPPAPPNGGLWAWLQLFAGFLLLFNSWGIINTFGVFQSYYEMGLVFQASPSQISWIGSAQAFFIMFSGIVTGPLYDRGHIRVLITLGGLLTVIGHVTLGSCSRYWQVLLSQGICGGLGAGCLYVPTISLLPTYFSTRLGLAIGVANAGAAFGGVVFPLMLSRLLDSSSVGFAWAVRAMALMSLLTIGLAVSLVRPRLKPALKPRKPVDLTAFGDAPFMALIVATLLSMMGVVVLQFYIVSFSEAFDLFRGGNQSIYLIVIYNAASIVGRVLPNYLSDRIGIFNLLAPAAALEGVVILCLIVVRTRSAIIVVSVITGFFSGIIIAMPPVSMAVLTKDKALIGTRIGTGYAVIAVGLLCCGPVAGAILGSVSPQRWTGVWAFCGTSLLVGSALYSGLRVHRGGFNLRVAV